MGISLKLRRDSIKALEEFLAFGGVAVACAVETVCANLAFRQSDSLDEIFNFVEFESRDAKSL